MTKALYNNKEELEARISEYFNSCPDIKKIYITSYNTSGKKETISIDVPYPTVSGLAIHLGFASRQSFYDYEKNEEYSYTIKRARLFIEREYEKRMLENPAGAIFALKNLGWTDKQEVQHSGDLNTTVMGKITIDGKPMEYKVGS